ncbi:MAG: polysaccharide biosynthesis C-terminal domain-containing protein [Bacteroidales bacterium]|nr:polysaccharide biosynthesis C-terminal domain-containing protein [Bacteroidales bacterium]HOI32606.1 polysaccharide biosynthesis C-terminal domain-containing protein [Bacteroidales bacterium]
MGIIKTQSITGTILSYLGVILGFVTTALLFPEILTKAEIGLLRLLVSVSVLFAQFSGLGFNAVTLRNFPYFRSLENNHHGFLKLSLIINLAGFLIAMIIFFSIKPWLISQNIQKSALFVEYFTYLIPLIFFTTFFNALDSYYRAIYNAVKGSLYKEVWQRVFIMLSVVLYYFDFISFAQLVFLYVVSMSLPTILIAWSIYRSGQFVFGNFRGFITKEMAHNMRSVAIFGIATSFSGILILNIDVVMINDMLGLADTGIYSTTFYFGTLILIPSRSVIKIAVIVIADGWKSNDTKKIMEIYDKSNRTLSAIGLLLFLGLMLNLDQVFDILGSDFEAGRMVIVFIGLANLIEMFTSVSQYIISNSAQYKVVTWFLVFFAVLLILTNLIFIPLYGLVGAAFASLIARFIYNFISWAFVYYKFGMQPFSWNYLVMIAIGLIAFFLARLTPNFDWYVWEIMVQSTVFTLLFTLMLYISGFSDDINQTIDGLLVRLHIKK